jgi:hypothetical protein
MLNFKILILIVLGTIAQYTFAQDPLKSIKYTAHNKGKFYIYWGGNRDSYSKSDIHFKGADYDFTLNDVEAVDRPVGWHINYINPTMMTIPQTNFRLGYFINDHYNISVGVDHMKYVMVQNQSVKINGSYPSIYIGNQVNNGLLDLSDETFLTFEHTDGLNYINSEISRVDDFSKYLGITNTDKIQINLTEGIGAGVLYPKTNAKVLEKERHDDFHFSGYGVSAKVGLNLTFFKHYFIQGELKGGYINMNDIQTTALTNDSASQHFMFLQRIISFGGIFNL